MVLIAVTPAKIKSETEKLVMFCSSQNIWREAHFQAYLNLGGRKEEKNFYTNDHIDLFHF